MSRWFRHYAGMMRDDKLVSTAIRSKQPIERVVWVWGAILESASEIDNGGLYRLDCAEVAYFLRADEADIRAVVDALADAGRVAGDHVVKWGDRQFQSDRSAERQARYRDKKRGQERNADDQPPSGDGIVTAASRHGDAPEAETETELEAERDKPLPQQPVAARENLLDVIADAVGLKGNIPPGWAVSIAAVHGLLSQGYDLQLDIIPGIKRVRKRGATLHYYVKPIEEYAAERRGANVTPAPPEPKAETWKPILEHWRENGDWNHSLGPPPGAPGCRVPAELLSRAA